jgi:hypothetical protein
MQEVKRLLLKIIYKYAPFSIFNLKFLDSPCNLGIFKFKEILDFDIRNMIENKQKTVQKGHC